MAIHYMYNVRTMRCIGVSFRDQTLVVVLVIIGEALVDDDNHGGDDDDKEIDNNLSQKQHQ